ncbi:MAG: YHS domain-containing (seleno)protein [Xanthobacteraceae bacterium]
MTAAGQRRKQCRVRAHWVAAVAVALIRGLTVSTGAGATEQVVVDWHNGLAISGFDPVAYFTEGAPTMGQADIEYTFAGAVWRFRNIGNRAAFLAAPQVYWPHFGGYDPVAVARGVAAPGNPKLWLIVEDRLYLFFDADARAAFAAEPGRFIADAEGRWPKVLRTLEP